MPPVPSISPATGKPTHPDFIHTTSFSFVDTSGRTLLLRGVNLSGASKAPLDHLSHILDDFWDTAEDGGESFVGRPLCLEDGSADVHLARLRGWGYNLLRFPFTWEALEHDGPKKYDYEFMDYLIRVLCKCRDYGFRVYMDPHQDVWSRFSGGSGAPYWTLAACGINPRNISATQAAIIHAEYPLPHCPDPAQLPAMVWSTNYGRLLSQTVFTLFFAGREFAPNAIIDGVNIQDYLQSHYIEAVGQLVDRIAAFDGGALLESCVIGWDSLNEPFEGLCGWPDLNANPTKQGSTLKKGTYPTPAQSLRLGMGQPQTVEHWHVGSMGPARDGSVTIDPKGRKVWADALSREEAAEGGVYGELPDGTHTKWGWKRDVTHWELGTCVWAQHGVWDVETGYVLRPDYFKFKPTSGEEVEFLTDFWKPHWLAYASRVRKGHREAMVFVQPPVFSIPPKFTEEETMGRCVYAPHYYDGLTLITRHWNWFNCDALGLLRGKISSPLQGIKIGNAQIRKSLQQQLGYLQTDADEVGPYPTVIGEIGTPFDMDQKAAYGWTDGGKHRGDYSQQEVALDASMNACDGPGVFGRGPLSYTVWTYVPDDHTHDWGDGWNLEDLSLFSRDDVRDLEYPEEKGGEVKYRDEQPVAVNLPLIPPTTMPHSGGAAAASGVTLTTLSDPVPSKRSPSALSSSSSSSSIHRKRCTRTLPDGYDPHTAWCPNPYDFLVNGSRGVRAASRPWPLKVVGRVVDVKFDLAKAVFRLVVRVRAEDRPNEGALGYPRRRRGEGEGGRGRGGERRSGGRRVDSGVDINKGGVGVSVMGVGAESEEEGDGDDHGIREHTRPFVVRAVDFGEKDDEDEEELGLATEVYLPLVHYAHQDILEKSAIRNGWWHWQNEGKALGGPNRKSRGEEVKDEEDGRSIVSVTSTGSEVSLGSLRGRTRTRTRKEATQTSTLTQTSTAQAPVLEAEPTGTTTSTTDTVVASDMGKVPSGGSRGRDTPELLKPFEKRGLLDVDVKVIGPAHNKGNGGRVKVVGQTLKWWYDLPPPPASPALSTVSLDEPLGSRQALHPHPPPPNVRKSGKDKDDGEWEYTLEVRRRGGPMKSVLEMDVERARIARGPCAGFADCGSACGEGCVVM